MPKHLKRFFRNYQQQLLLNLQQTVLVGMFLKNFMVHNLNYSSRKDAKPQRFEKVRLQD
jgi:hypothetical protein